jgi:hypothetical protein
MSAISSFLFNNSNTIRANSNSIRARAHYEAHHCVVLSSSLLFNNCGFKYLHEHVVHNYQL